MNKKVIAFGDVHLQWQAMRLILDEARKESIDTVITLGDEAHKIYPFATGDQKDYDRMWHELRVYRDEKPDRELILTLGDKTAGVARDMVKHFVGVDEKTAKVNDSIIYKNDNVLAGHIGQRIIKDHGEFIKNYQGEEPLVIFHGHSHSMGVLPDYVWLKENDMVHMLDNEEHYQLEPGKVYWVNPGGQFLRSREGLMAANYATYDPKERLVTLKTIFYDEDKIKPSKKEKII